MKASLKSVVVLFVLVLISFPLSADAGAAYSGERIPLLNYELSESEASVSKAVKDRPSVALVLSGGGARGIAYIPLLEEIENLGIPIDKVFGTSIGSLIGGLYCAGYSPREMMDICRNSNLISYFTETSLSGPNEVFGALDYSRNNLVSLSFGNPSGGTAGVVDNYRIMSLMYKCLGNVPDNADFNRDLVIPFECNAVDMQSGKEVIFSEGSLITAMRASMSMPAVFEPVRTDDGRILMDGGVVDNSMVHRARLEGFDIVICASYIAKERALILSMIRDGSVKLLSSPSPVKTAPRIIDLTLFFCDRAVRALFRILSSFFSSSSILLVRSFSRYLKSTS